jgi:hypothetical protein
MGYFVSAVVDHLTSNPRTKGSNPAAVTEREKMMKNVLFYFRITTIRELHNYKYVFILAQVSMLFKLVSFPVKIS